MIFLFIFFIIICIDMLMLFKESLRFLNISYRLSSPIITLRKSVSLTTSLQFNIGAYR